MEKQSSPHNRETPEVGTRHFVELVWIPVVLIAFIFFDFKVLKTIPDEVYRSKVELLSALFFTKFLTIMSSNFLAWHGNVFRHFIPSYNKLFKPLTPRKVKILGFFMVTVSLVGYVLL